jgi:hypothetical protein
LTGEDEGEGEGEGEVPPPSNSLPPGEGGPGRG